MHSNLKYCIEATGALLPLFLGLKLCLKQDLDLDVEDLPTGAIILNMAVKITTQGSKILSNTTTEIDRKFDKIYFKNRDNHGKKLKKALIIMKCK